MGRYEELIREYERVSGSRYSEDLRNSTIVAAAPPALQAQLHMALGPDTTYQEVRDKILLYERSTAKWHTNTSLAMPSLQDSSGPTPMEVDRVEKGKKGKGKKGKGTKDGSKGKDGKGKKKGKNKGGSGRDSSAPECFNCGKRGHYARDCWSKPAKGKGKSGRVNQVQEEATPATPSGASTSSAASTSASTTQGKGVRMIRMVTPPSAPILEVYDMAEGENEGD